MWWSNCHKPIYPSSTAVHKMMVHLLVTHQWFILVVQQIQQNDGSFTFHTPIIYPSCTAVHKVMVHLLVIQVVQQSIQSWSVYLSHTNNLSTLYSSPKSDGTFTCYPSSTAVHTIMVHLLVTHQWFILVVQQSTKWWSIYLSQTTFDFSIVVQQSTKWWSIYLSHTTDFSL